MKRILKWLAQLYPSTWRNRYGAEYEALLEQIEPNAGDAVDVLWGVFKMQMATWSFVKTVLVCSLAGTVAAVAISQIAPKRYVSEALISVDTLDGQPIDHEVAEQAPNRFDSSFLTSVIQKENLYPRERDRLPMDAVVDLLRKNIWVLPVSAKDRKPASAFIVYFVYPDPHIAQRVDSELVSGLTAANLGTAINSSSNVSRPPMGFRVEYVANLPQHPTFPQPSLFGAGGLVAGLFGGLVVATIAKGRRLAVATG